MREGTVYPDAACASASLPMAPTPVASRPRARLVDRRAPPPRAALRYSSATFTAVGNLPLFRQLVWRRRHGGGLDKLGLMASTRAPTERRRACDRAKCCRRRCSPSPSSSPLVLTDQRDRPPSAVVGTSPLSSAARRPPTSTHPRRPRRRPHTPPHGWRAGAGLAGGCAGVRVALVSVGAHAHARTRSPRRRCSSEGVECFASTASVRGQSGFCGGGATQRSGWGEDTRVAGAADAGGWRTTTASAARRCAGCAEAITTEALALADGRLVQRRACSASADSHSHPHLRRVQGERRHDAHLLREHRPAAAPTLPANQHVQDTGDILKKAAEWYYSDGDSNDGPVTARARSRSSSRARRSRRCRPRGRRGARRRRRLAAALDKKNEALLALVRRGGAWRWQAERRAKAAAAEVPSRRTRRSAASAHVDTSRRSTGAALTAALARRWQLAAVFDDGMFVAKAGSQRTAWPRRRPGARAGCPI